MIEQAIARLVDSSRKYAVAVIVFFALLTAAAGFYAGSHFSINTDVTDLIDAKAPWRQREIAFSAAFPQRDDLLVVVIDSKDGVGSDIVAEKLSLAMQARKDLFHQAQRPETNSYFSRYGLMLLPLNDLVETGENLIKAQPLLGSLAVDPSLRGLFGATQLMLGGVQAGQVTLQELNPLIARIDKAFSFALTNPTDANAWRYLMASDHPSKFEQRRFILARPVLDFASLSPGEAATKFIRDIITEQKLEQTYQVHVRLTGSVALSDEEFASIAQGMEWAIAASIILIGIILYMALRSWRLIVPIFAVLGAGLAITLAFALLAIGSLNLISVAFAVMFVGLAVDFGIQFGVRLRDVRRELPDLHEALSRTGFVMAIPLLLAALTTAAGFFSFLPTSYRGVAELGEIAGFGMLLAFFLNVTLLPAILRFTSPPSEKEPVGFADAAPIDAALETHRKPILYGFGAAFALAVIACVFLLRFDFDPINLKDPDSESVGAMLELAKDPDSTPYTIDILAENSEKAEQLAERIRQLPEVDKVLTLLSMVPDQQGEKIAIINDTAGLLATTLHPSKVQPAPKPADIRASALQLAEMLASTKDLSPDAQKLHDQLLQLSQKSDEDIGAMQMVFEQTIQGTLLELQERLKPKKIDFTDIPNDLKHDWIAPDGQARLEVYPKGDPRDERVLVKFTQAVQRIAPEATGMPVSIQESAATIKRAFLEAGLYTLIAISILLFLILKRIRDVLLVLAPLVLAAVFTLGTASLLGLPINFANIIALPLIFGLGASYDIYFVVYWLQGHEKPLQSAMARAVLFSAATAVVAFGSLSFSNHIGTASMGLLLMISLFYVLFSTLFFLPTLLGKPAKSHEKFIA
jgi:hopanoid biosynthesis associated RND transporter like protein HpnN